MQEDLGTEYLVRPVARAEEEDDDDDDVYEEDDDENQEEVEDDEVYFSFSVLSTSVLGFIM